MKVHPDISALRSDEVAQRCLSAATQKFAREWRARSEVAAIAGSLADYGAGSDLAGCSELAALMNDVESAQAFADTFCTMMVRAMRACPLGETPFSFRGSRGFATIQLMASARAELRLCVYEPLETGNIPPPQTALFPDRESIEIVLSGKARASLHRMHDEGDAMHIETHIRDLTTGERIDLMDRKMSRQILEVDKSTAFLQLTRTPCAPLPLCERRLSDGALIKSASGDKSASQKVMALAVLGAMDHEKAISSMEACARDAEQDAEVRWEAARQLLAKDARRGLSALSTLTRAKHTSLRASSVRLLHDLGELRRRRTAA